jgi:SAM-dependent methyltransferase
VIEASLDYLKDKKIDADLILLLDVLEHLENDKDSLEIIKNATRKGALLCITVPADPTLWSKLDEDVFHFRRYTKESILSLLDSGGWEIIEIRYWMSLLKPVARFRRKFLKGNFMSETKLPNRFINLLLKILLSLEAKSVFGKFPGTTILVVARN